MGRLIFHIDVNSAFLSWEAARRVARGEADLRLIPSCVGRDPQKRSSIVSAKSIPAKRYGIRTGEPVTMALRKCPELVVVEPDFAWYTECSKAFMNICRRYSPALEKFSIDECYLDMTGLIPEGQNPVETAVRLKDEIRDTLGFTVNVGVGPNKLLAKTAGDFEKPDKVHVLMEGDIPVKFWPLPVRELLFVGKSTAERLRGIGIYTIGELAMMDLERLKSIMGVKQGIQLHNYANGIDDSPVRVQSREAKSYSVERTVEEDLTDRKLAVEILGELAEKAAGRLRRDQVRAACVAVVIRSSDFRNRSHQRHLPQATDLTSEIMKAARELLDELWDGETPLRLLGLSLSDLTREVYEQLSLFADERQEKERKLDRLMAQMESRFGPGAVCRGAQGLHSAGVDAPAGDAETGDGEAEMESEPEA